MQSVLGCVRFGGYPPVDSDKQFSNGYQAFGSQHNRGKGYQTTGIFPPNLGSVWFSGYPQVDSAS